MVSKAELLRRLAKVGFRLVAHGKKHDIYEHVRTGKRVVVARHSKEIPNGTYRAILRDADLE